MTHLAHQVRAHQVVGLVGVTALAAAGGLHAAWAVGSTWPARTSEELADLVVGKQPMPGPVACAVVASTLAVASVGTASAVLGTPRRSGATRAADRVAKATAVGMLARGTIGFAADVVVPGDPSTTFRRWNRRLYSPLCLAIAACAWLGQQRPSDCA